MSQLSAVRFKLMAIVVYRHLLGAPLDYDKLDRYLSVGGGEKRTRAEVEALVAALSFVLLGGAKHEVAAEDLQRELQQVGLPREHGLMLRRPYAKYSPQLTRRLQSKTLRVDRLKTSAWRVDLVLARSAHRSASAAEGQLRLTTDERDDAHPLVVTLSREKLAVLLAECKAALQVMQETK